MLPAYAGMIPIPEIEYENETAKAEFKAHERLTVKALAQNGFAVEVPQRSQKEGVKTADTTINGASVEMKAPEGNSKNTIDGLLRRAAKQGKAAVIDLQAGRTDMDSDDCKEAIQQALRRRSVEYVLFIDYDNSILRFMKEAVSESQ